MSGEPATIATAVATAAALHQAGRLDEAAAAYAAVLHERPDHADALHLSGVVAAQRGRFEDAARLMAQAAALVPAAKSYRDNLGKALRRMEPLRQAAALAAAADALADLRRAGAAAGLYQAALALQPAAPALWFNIGVARRDAGETDGAERAFARVVRLHRLARAGIELGGLRLARGDVPAAVAAFAHAASADPCNVDARLGAANAAKTAGDLSGAVARYRLAAALDPGRAVCWFNLAVTCGDLHLHAQALGGYRRAVALSPDFADAHYNLAHQLLLSGDFAAGWREFEWRFKIGVRVDPRGRPRWRGEDPAGRTVLLQAEQGHGDTLQFIRYAPLLAARGARVLVECQPGLVRLIATVPGVAAAYPPGGATDFDLTCPMMSLPAAFATTLETIPADIPYLAERFAGDERFERYFPDDGGCDGRALRVGLVWSGDPRPNDPRLFRANQRRSIAPAAFAPLLARHPEVRFFSLQKGAAADQALSPPFAGRLIDPMVEVEDFADAAAVVRRLDLVISVDTSVVHLAGALGKPVWVLSRFDGCWRWLTERDDSPWYRDCRIFRQPRPDDWETPLAAVANALAGFRNG